MTEDAAVLREFYEDETVPHHSAELLKSRRLTPDPAPVRFVELFSVLQIVVLADVTVYRGHGFGGYAALFGLVPVLLGIGTYRRRGGWKPVFLGGMMILLAARLAWCGSGLQVGVGLSLLFAFAMALAGRVPYVLDVVATASQTLPAGFAGLFQYRKSLGNLGPSISRAGWWNVALPAAAFVVFGWLFVLANPDLFAAFGEGLQAFFTGIREWLVENAPVPLEIGFWVLVGVIAVGLIRPLLRHESEHDMPASTETVPVEAAPVEAAMYPAFRNTLITVIALFAVYLAFEFQTLWFRVFPEGFYYSGYAHSGAAWLTVALTLATLLLSLVFRGEVLRDPRAATLRKLAWFWSLENVILAAAVYHRLFIYAGFNGMTRMRVVALYGMSAVVVGFVLVLWKIARNHDFTWLLRRHLWTLAIAVYLFSITPVDMIVMRYNVNRILAGDPAPAVQISVHPIDSEGIAELLPLLDSDNETIREGIRALLSDRYDQAVKTAKERADSGWTATQLSDRRSLRILSDASEQWSDEESRVLRTRNLNRFHKYVYQWF